MTVGEPVFLLQIVRPDGDPVRFPGGGLLERDLIAAIVTETTKRLGPFATRAGVEKAVREGAAQAILELKRETVVIAAG
jgi:hypothetical protein